MLPPSVLATTLALSLIGATAEKAARSHVWEPRLDPSKSLISVTFRDVEIDKFAAEVLVGTPPQPVSLLASLVISDLLVLNHKIEPRAFYDHSKSTTYDANGTRVEMYVASDVTLTGFASRDTVALHNREGDGLVVHDQLFMEIDGPDEVLGSMPPKVGGFFGWGPRRANSTGAPSVVQTMAAQGAIDRPVVGLRFDDRAMHATFGGVDDRFCEEREIVYHGQNASTPGTWWTVPLAGIDVDGAHVIGDSGRAFVMDFFEGIVGPQGEIQRLAEAVGVKDINQLPCEGDGPEIQVRLGDTGAGITLTKKAYTLPPVDEGLCFFAFQNYKHGPIEPPAPGEPWVFGLGLLRNVYTALDLGGGSHHAPRIGFAPLKAAV